METVRLIYAIKQPWISATVRPNSLEVKYPDVKMRTGSKLPERMWTFTLHVHTTFQDHMANYQTEISGEWERAYLAKAVKEDQRKRASKMFPSVQFILGNREMM